MATKAPPSKAAPAKPAPAKPTGTAPAKPTGTAPAKPTTAAPTKTAPAKPAPSVPAKSAPSKPTGYTETKKAPPAEVKVGKPPARAFEYKLPTEWKSDMDAKTFTLKMEKPEIDESGVGVYVITLRCGKKDWQVGYDYGELERFKDDLAANPAVMAHWLGHFPHKIFKKKNDPKFLEKRQNKLQKFWNEILSKGAIPLLPFVRKFLELDESSV